MELTEALVGYRHGLAPIQCESAMKYEPPTPEEIAEREAHEARAKERAIRAAVITLAEKLLLSGQCSYDTALEVAQKFAGSCRAYMEAEFGKPI